MIHCVWQFDTAGHPTDEAWNSQYNTNRRAIISAHSEAGTCWNRLISPSREKGNMTSERTIEVQRFHRIRVPLSNKCHIKSRNNHGSTSLRNQYYAIDDVLISWEVIKHACMIYFLLFAAGGGIAQASRLMTCGFFETA